MNAELQPVLRQVVEAVRDERITWEDDFERRHGHQPSDDDARVWGDHALVAALQAWQRDAIAAGVERLTESEEDWLIDAARARLFGFGVLDALLADPRVENVTANGCDFVRVTYVGGEKRPGPALADSDAELDDLIRRLAATAASTERRFDDAVPFLDLQLPDGSRLHAIKGVAQRPCVSIRRHRFVQVTLADLVELATMDTTLARFLSAAVRAPLNIVVAGGTDAGKTTLLRALAADIPADERLVVIEDNRELQLGADGDRDVVELETRAANVEGAGEIGMGELVRQSLRMRPDRVIVGEIRGGEAVEMFKAMSTGNDGSLTTLHSDSSAGALVKMRLYAAMGTDGLSMEASAELIAQSIDLVVHLRKTTGGARVVSSVREVTGAVERTTVHTNEIWAPDGSGVGQLTGTALSERTRARLEAVGFDPAVELFAGVPA